MTFQMPAGSTVYIQIGVIVICSALRKLGYLDGSTYDVIVALLLGGSVAALKAGQNKAIEVAKQTAANPPNPNL